MIANAQPSEHGISGDTKARDRARSRRLELYTRSIFRGLKKKSSRSFCRPPGGRPRCGYKIDGDEIKKRRR
jgi:hypothetical protein